MEPSDDELSDEQLRAELRAELDAVLPAAPRWETLPWHVRPPWPRRIQWARRAALATGFILGAGLLQHQWLSDDATAPPNHTTNAPPEPSREAEPPPVNQPEPSVSPSPSSPAPPAQPAPTSPPPTPTLPLPDPSADGDALVSADPEPEPPNEWTRGSGQAPVAITFAVRVMRDGQCKRLDSTHLPLGLRLCFQLSVRPSAEVAVMVEAPGGTSELARLQGGPERVLVGTTSGEPLTFTPRAAGPYRFYAVVLGETCGPDCHSVTLDIAP